ncbi:hypothetical protein EST38_g7292 [Candolleomyces aberdarensis]|uniref:Uncharacterized protein n=1 Tax=Candolleomyces aberdarensis TaxID=2316362 RepID=A0A4Q2DFG9_9AGAR|nr:hypothetical protein EST38_g7292 [Candolleomyces aberdarensis]
MRLDRSPSPHQEEQLNGLDSGPPATLELWANVQVEILDRGTMPDPELDSALDSPYPHEAASKKEEI